MMDSVQEYLNQIISALEEERFFDIAPISKKVMIDCLLKAMDRNLDTTGDFRLSDKDFQDVYHSAVNRSVSDSITDCLQEGLIEITGVDPNGELIYGLTEDGRKEIEPVSKDQVLTAKFERLGPFGTYCLN
jgi:hypothetical protein